jgi:hypothetical protein
MPRPIQTTASGGGARPTDAAIAKRAYEISLQRGSAPGHEMDDWLQAEAELLAATAKPSQDSTTPASDEERDDQAGSKTAGRAEPSRAEPRRGRDNGQSRRSARQPHSH